MAISRAQLLENEARLRNAAGPKPLRRFLTEGRQNVAERAVAGEVRFEHIGEKYFHVGRSGIDWSGPQIRHQEWPAQLNRFFQLADLLAMYEKTGAERYAEAARDYIADWIRAHPASAGWTLARYDNTLNLSIRVMVWLGALPSFLASQAFDGKFVEAVTASAACQLEFLTTHLSSAGNWRIAQADALMTAGLRLDGSPGAEAWRRLGAHVLNDAFRRQVLPDGVHCERNPDYHQWMTGVFEDYWRLARAMPELGLELSAATIGRMHDYALASLRPTGGFNALHDCAGAHAGRRAPSWDAARRRFLQEAGLPTALPPTSQNFPDAGQACWRDSWDEDAAYVTFDATTWGGGHCHLSRNAVQLHAAGRSLLVDPGALTYETSDPMMAHGKSTRAHNTLNLNGWNQSQADPVSRFAGIAGYDFAEALYAGGYWPGGYQWAWNDGHGAGVWGQHHRLALWIHGRCLIVIDTLCADAAGPERPFAESNWQFPEGRVLVDETLRRAQTTHEDSNLLVLFPLAPDGTRMSLRQGEKDPPRGWLRGENGYRAAPQLCLTVAPAPAQSHWVTVLTPFRGSRAPEAKADARMEPTGLGRLVLRWAGGETDTVLWRSLPGGAGAAIGNTDGIETDASLARLRRGPAGDLIAGAAVGGSYVTSGGKTFRSAAGIFAF